MKEEFPHADHQPPLITPPTVARAQAPTALPPRIQARASDGPPPEYSLWAMLKDIGQRIGDFFRNLF
ncbi:MAG: hypothetical protein ACLGIN_01150 [Candidatus Sericytochromatia bacterium]